MAPVLGSTHDAIFMALPGSVSVKFELTSEYTSSCFRYSLTVVPTPSLKLLLVTYSFRGM